jgi:DNA-binding transcriptional MerR regulator
MIKIGDFARITNVSIKALRFYEEMKLLAPMHVDPFSGYRYYSARQLPTLNRILFFKQLGFSLQQIQSLLADDIPARDLREILEAKQDEVTQTLALAREQLANIATLIKHIDQEGRKPAYEVRFKEVEAQRVACFRSRFSDYGAVDRLFSRSFPRTEKAAHARLRGAIWHKCAHDRGEIDCEALVFLDDDLAAPPAWRIRELAACTVASIVHREMEPTTPLVYTSAMEAIESRGYEIEWPMREFYFSTGNNLDFDAIETQFVVSPLQLDGVQRTALS